MTPQEALERALRARFNDLMAELTPPVEVERMILAEVGSTLAALMRPYT